MDFDAGFLADWLSIIGFLFTLATAFYAFIIDRKISKIRNKILFDSSLPKLIKDLRTTNTDLSTLLPFFDNSSHDIKLNISHSAVILQSIRKKLSKSEKGNIDKAIKKNKSIKISNFNKVIEDVPWWQKFSFTSSRAISENDIWEYYAEISALIKELEYLYEDKSKFDRYA